MQILVTGAAGFIGYHVCLYLMTRGENVVGVDNLNDYYSVDLKKTRLKRLTEFSLDQLDESGYSGSQSQKKKGVFSFEKLDISCNEEVKELFKTYNIVKVVNLAAQAGVRYSIENPHAYVQSNIVGFVNILEGCRHNNVSHLVYASSSSVYGANKIMPFSVSHNVDHPLSLYAASKKSNELMAHTYSHLYNLPTTGLRFFTVYGPWGRPDMALYLFTKSIIEDKPIKVFNYGNHRRDFTYIDDIVEGIIRTLDNIAQPNEQWSGLSPDPSTSKAPWKVYNIGNNSPIELLDYIAAIEKYVGKKAKQEFLPLQPGDIPDNYADVSALMRDMNYKPSTTIEEGISKFVEWYTNYYQELESEKV